MHALLGIAELRLGRPDDAIASLARALELQPDFHAARVQFACALHAAGQTHQAAEQLQMVLDAEPGHRDARQILASWSPRARSRAHDRRA
jgi:predicted Zn-dependent protease